MGIVFAVLILLGIVIYLLGLLDRRTAASEEPPVRSDTASSLLPQPAGPSVSPQIVAVIGAALALAQSEVEGAATALAGARAGEAAPAGWYASGLTRQMASRSRPAIRRSR